MCMCVYEIANVFPINVRVWCVVCWCHLCIFLYVLYLCVYMLMYVMRKGVVLRSLGG